MPRTVCTNSGLAGSRSILRRSRLTCTSTARSLTDAAVAGRAPAAARSRPASRPSSAQHLALAIGEVDDLLAAAQLAAREVKDGSRRSATDSTGGAGGGARALEDVGDAQRPARAARTAWRHSRRRRSAGPRSGSRPRRAPSASGSARSRTCADARARSKPVSPGIMTSRIRRSKCRPVELGARVARRSSAVVTR